MMAPRRKQHEHDEDNDRHNGPEMQDPDMPIWVNKFTEDSARAFVKQLQYQSNQNPAAPIVVYIDSYGGEVYSVLTIDRKSVV